MKNFSAPGADRKDALLNHIYRVYEKMAVPDNIACKRGCSQCCTCNVTLTGLEAMRIAEYIMAEEKTELIDALQAASGRKRFQSRFTTNQMADFCMQGQEIPEEENDPAWGPCPLLTNGECPVYPVRPFGCRCMVSSRNCGETGYADMSEFTAMVNEVFLQYIEHVDTGGYFGNLTDMLLYLLENRNLQNYRDGIRGNMPENLIANQPLRALMVPPEFREKIRPLLQALENPE
ncbi:MAG: hypothetical protein AB7S75_22175 [Desulfococcaceae bacterium]